MLDELLHEHEELRARASRLQALVANPWPPKREELNDARARMMTGVSEHVLFESSLANELARDHPELAAIRARLDRVGACWLRDLIRHGHRWTAPTVKADWLGYRAEKRALLERLCSHLDDEERQFYEPLKQLFDGRTLAASRSAKS